MNKRTQASVQLADGKRLDTARLKLSCMPLALAAVSAQPAAAANLTASSTADLVTDVGQANVSPDASSTIKLSQSFVFGTGTQLLPTTNLTIDTQGFTLSGSLSVGVGSGTVLTLDGSFSGAGGLVGQGVGLSGGTAINNGSIAGSSGTGPGGNGAVLAGAITFTNNGSITGGTGATGFSGGIGVNSSIAGVETLTNTGVIRGGDTAGGGGGGAGLAFGVPLGDSLNNSGTISGGADLSGVHAGGVAVNVRKTGVANAVSIVNSGVLAGGNDALAILYAGNLDLTNSGTIQAGSGQANAIAFNGTGSVNLFGLTLELDKGSVIIGNVLGNAASTLNTLVLGGSANDSFDASSIGSTAQYQNFNAFEKTGTSTWTLTGTTNAVTPWTLADGVLQISSDGNLGAASGALIFNGGALENTADVISARSVTLQSNGTLLTDAGTTLTLNGSISGAGALTKAGSGTLVLNAADTYAGGTSIVAGALAVGDASHTNAMLGAGLTTVATGGTLGGYGIVPGTVSNSGTIAVGSALQAFALGNTGSLRIGGDLSNSGVINLAAASGQVGNVLNVAGNYTGQKGQVTLNAVLNAGGIASQADQLVVAGNASGTTLIKVVRVAGTGAATVGDGIRLIQVKGTSAVNSFRLASAVQAGAYQYLMYQGGAASTNDWYLRSELDPTATGATMIDTNGATSGPIAYRPGVVGYSITPQLNADYGFAALGRLQERVGDVASLDVAQPANSNGIWGRLDGQNLDADAGQRFSADEHTFLAQFGKDWTLARGTDGGSTHAGATLTFGSTSASFNDSARSNAGLSDSMGTVETQAQTIGGYWTKYLPDGSYFDGVGQLTHYQNRYSDATGVGGSQNGFGTALSGEVGKPFSLGSTGAAIEPQAQLIYQYLHLNHFDDGVSGIDADTTNGLRGRLGFRLFKANMTNDTKTSTLTPQFTVDVLHDFFSPGRTSVGGTSFEEEMGKTWYDVGVGVTGSFGTNSELYANVKYEHSMGGEYRRNVFGQVGYRYSW